MNMKNNKYILSFLLALAAPFVGFTHSMAQELLADTIDDNAFAVDSVMPDTLSAEQLTLPWPQTVKAHIDNLLRNDMFRTSQVGIMVYDLDADSAIYRHNECQLMRPASTMKLITAITAIDRLGGGYQFSTELCYTGQVSERTLNGNVYCVGGFDPRFNSDDLKAFVEGLRKMGVDTIRGNIYADKTMKDTAQYGSGWCWDDDNPVLSPLLISRKDNFMPRFLELLHESNIVVLGTTGQAPRPDGAYCIARRSHTIDQVLMSMMKDSNNLYAESLFYQIAASTGNRPANARHARHVEERLIAKVGLNPKRYRIADGSGLSLYNYVTPELEVRLLRYAFNNNNVYMHLQPSLPVAGIDGTLSRRMRGPFTQGNVRAKTGTVEGITSLAGYCTAANGHRLAFAIINQGVLHAHNGRAFQDSVCTILCQP